MSGEGDQFEKEDQSPKEMSGCEDRMEEDLENEPQVIVIDTR